jgi:pyridoxal phosphate-dependent aminotransferase EpsN
LNSDVNAFIHILSSCEVIDGTVAEELFTQGLCFPSGSNLTDRDRQRVMEAIASMVNPTMA